ncbi:rhomboid family intramembrane serine protease [Aquamicrobium zhengzhouense]|uniref:Rhomboid family intramembrane serine protease n=1 Tax=Aquamicrobium zhengzhouense TaxID=2781738 RepID=A0ABS0SFS0_9HYPH|nr:rhomboid family intramembrane serine protease [Aquamicrobium zhengzhouense]MBI1621460.1 rhomboid family intramembrane serine protease [Aquamicrobium zhengzhouense]
MFIPLHDANEFRNIKIQYVTLSLIAINVVAYLLTTVGTDDFVNAAVWGLGYIPSTIFDIAERPPEMVIVPDDWTFLTYSFLHGDIWHLGGNMLFLWVFGDNVEDALGHFRYLVFYLACAAAGALVHGLIVPDSEAPLIGASGAIAGIVAAYLILHPRVKIWVLALGRIPLRLPAWILLALWILFQFAMIFAGGDESISWAAHVGGIVAGAILVLILRRRNVPLADATVVTPKAVEVERPAQVEPQIRSPWGRQ